MAPVVDAMKNVKDLARRTDDNNGSDMTVKRRGVRNSPFRSNGVRNSLEKLHFRSNNVSKPDTGVVVQNPNHNSGTYGPQHTGLVVQTFTLVHMDHNIPT